MANLNAPAVPAPSKVSIEPVLWLRLIDLPLDHLAEEPLPAFGFVKRLMRDETWDYARAIRVTAEYRRFLLLAATGPVSPPPQVDAAWHLHLTYTRAYNIGLCERTLGHALDHNPSSDADDTAHYAAVYEGTLKRYREVFREEPPVDVWPTPAAAFAAPQAHGKSTMSARIVLFAALVLMLFVFLRHHAALLLPLAAVAGIAVFAGSAEGATRKDKSSGSCGSSSSSCGSGGDGGCGCGSGCSSGCGGGCGG